jgi:hypothetical protein
MEKAAHHESAIEHFSLISEAIDEANPALLNVTCSKPGGTLIV